jgi:plastocyanin
VLGLIAACEAPPDSGPRMLELANDTILLEEGVSLVDVKVRRSAEGDFDPAAVEAHTGDVVRFVADDNGGHAIVFESTALAGDVREWLERTGQLRSPPLITSGASWVVTLDGAPAGDYPFRCSTHSASGRLSVAAR